MSAWSAKLRALVGCLAALAVSTTGALAQSAAERLEEFVKVAQFGSPYGVKQRFPEEWCHYTRTDREYGWWYLVDALTDSFGPVKVHNRFIIPFMFDAYGTRRLGAIVVGYAIDGGMPKTKLDKVVPPTRTMPECSIGVDMLLRAPHAVVGLAADLPLQTMADPAPEYHYWQVGGRIRKVRLILAVPASFRIGPSEVSGRIIVAFTSDG